MSLPAAPVEADLLGPALASYSTNKATLAVVVSVGLFVVLLGSVPVWDAPQQDAKIWLEALAGMSPFLAPVVFLLVWLLKVKVSLHQDGIVYRSLFGTKQMRWDQVERFYYRATKRSVNFIPVGTYYWFKLVDVQGNKISFGNRVERPGELGDRLVKATYQPLFQKAADLYDSGAELDFGPIRLSRQDGLKVKKTFGHKHIPWNQLADYGLQKGHFYIWPVGKKYVSGHEMGAVPNTLVLLGLLDAICGRQQPPPGSP